MKLNYDFIKFKKHHSFTSKHHGRGWRKEDIIKLFNFKNKYTFEALIDDDGRKEGSKKKLDCLRQEKSIFERKKGPE